MAANNGRRGTGGVISLPGLLFVLAGLGLLFAGAKYFLVPRFIVPAVGSAGRIAFYTLTTGMVLWGTKLILDGYFADSDGRRARLSRTWVSVPWQWVFYLMIMLVCFAGSLLGRSNMLMLVFAIMVGPFVLNGWAAYSMLKRMNLRRSLPSRAMAGTPVPVEVIVENRKWLIPSWLMTVHDQIEGDDESLDAGVLFARIPHASQRAAHYQFRPMRRGRYRFGPMNLTTRFPLGLVERGRQFDVPGELLVHPRLGRLSAAWKRNQFMAHELVHRENRRRGVFDDEFHGIREYRWGDNPRAIHWRTSARHSDLMVREYHQSRDQNLLVLLDLWQPRTPREIDRESVELAVSLAASICVDHMRLSGDSELFLYVEGAGHAHWEGHSRPKNIEPMLDELAVVEAGPSGNVDRLADIAATKRGPGTRGLIITTRSVRGTDDDSDDQVRSSLRSIETGSDFHLIEVAEDRVVKYFEFSQ